MNQERTLTFGKYKGQEIKYIILTHIGYIMWCFENIGWFKLTDEEQAIYDAVAIMIKKEGCQMTFPVGLMYKHVKDREAFERLETPFSCLGGYTCIKKSDRDNSICKSIEKYKTPRIILSERSSSGSLSLGGLSPLVHVMDKEIERAYLNGETDEEIFGGWCSMDDY